MEMPKMKGEKKKFAIIGAISAVGAAAVLGAVALVTNVNTVNNSAQQADDKFIMADWELTDVANRVSASEEEIRKVVQDVLQENGYDLSTKNGLSDSAISYIQGVVSDRISEALVNYDASGNLSDEEVAALETTIADDVYNILVSENMVAKGDSKTESSSGGSAASTPATTVVQQGLTEAQARAISQQVANSSVTGMNSELATLRQAVQNAQNSLNTLQANYANQKGVSTQDLNALKDTINTLPQTASAIDSETYTKIRTSINTVVSNLSGLISDTETGLADIELQLAGKVSSQQLEALKQDYVNYVAEAGTALAEINEKVAQVEEEAGNSMADVTTMIGDVQSKIDNTVEAVKLMNEKSLTDLKNTLISQIEANQSLSEEQQRILKEKVGQLEITNETSIENLREQLTAYIRENQDELSGIIDNLKESTAFDLNALKTDLKKQIEDNASLSEENKTYLKGLIDDLDETTVTNLATAKSELSKKIADNTTLTNDNKDYLKGLIDTLDETSTYNLEQTKNNLKAQIDANTELTNENKTYLKGLIDTLDEESATNLSTVKDALNQKIKNNADSLSETATTLNDTITSVNSRLSVLESKNAEAAEDLKQTIINQILQSTTLSDAEKQALIEKINALSSEQASSMEALKEALEGIKSQIANDIDQAIDRLSVTPGADINTTKSELISQVESDANLTDAEKQILIDMIKNLDASVAGDINKIRDALRGKLTDLDSRFGEESNEWKTGDEYLQTQIDDTLSKIMALTEGNEAEMQSLIDMIGNTYTPSMTYKPGSYCVQDKVLYRCTTPITLPEEFNVSHWVAVNLANEVDAKSKLITDEFSPINSYSKGDLVIHENKLYRLKIASQAAGTAWNASNWEQTTIEKEMSDNAATVDERMDALEAGLGSIDLSSLGTLSADIENLKSTVNTINSNYAAKSTVNSLSSTVSSLQSTVNTINSNYLSKSTASSTYLAKSAVTTSTPSSSSTDSTVPTSKAVYNLLNSGSGWTSLGSGTSFTLPSEAKFFLVVADRNSNVYSSVYPSDASGTLIIGFISGTGNVTMTKSDRTLTGKTSSVTWEVYWQ